MSIEITPGGDIVKIKVYVNAWGAIVREIDYRPGIDPEKVKLPDDLGVKTNEELMTFYNEQRPLHEPPEKRSK